MPFPSKEQLHKSREQRRRLSGHATRGFILDVATQCFAEFGFEVVSMRQIAKKAKLTAPAIYFYFEDKNALYMACCSHIFSGMTQSLNKELQRDEPAATKIHKFIHLLVKELLTHPNTAKLFQRELVSTKKDILQFLKHEAFEETFKIFAHTLSEAMPVENPELLAVSIYSLALGHIQFSQVLESAGDTTLCFADKPEALANHIIQLAGIPKS